MQVLRGGVRPRSEALDLLMAAQGTPDVVYHLAGGSSVGASLQAPSEDFRRTTISTALLLEWLRTKAPQAKLVCASSAAVYGDTGGLPATETYAPLPVSPYGHHKLMMEQEPVPGILADLRAGIGSRTTLFGVR